jgi:AbrB family looped-hinge helix DNA binding protein
MAKVTSKRQITLPKSLADRYGIQPGDEITFAAAGDAIRIEPAPDRTAGLSREARLALFDAATARQRARQRAGGRRGRLRKGPKSRGWTRAELYTRGRAD